jgi:hypothetical protein
MPNHNHRKKSLKNKSKRDPFSVVMSESSEANNHRSRISALEQGQAALEAGQESLGREVGQLRDVVLSLNSEVRTGFNKIAESRTNDQKANWPVFLSSATVLLALGALVSGGINADFRRLDGEVDIMQDRDFETAGDRWRRADHDQFADNVREDTQIVEKSTNLLLISDAKHHERILALERAVYGKAE